MLLYNPTKSKLSVIIKGREYSIESENTIEVEDKVGMYWKTSLHNFLEIKESVPVKSNAQNKEIKTENNTTKENEGEKIDSEDKVVEEIEEEILEEIVVAPTPKKTNKSNNK